MRSIVLVSLVHKRSDSLEGGNVATHLPKVAVHPDGRGGGDDPSVLALLQNGPGGFGHSVGALEVGRIDSVPFGFGHGREGSREAGGSARSAEGIRCTNKEDQGKGEGKEIREGEKPYLSRRIPALRTSTAGEAEPTIRLSSTTRRGKKRKEEKTYREENRKRREQP
jgi:hypothetical protein